MTWSENFYWYKWTALSTDKKSCYFVCMVAFCLQIIRLLNENIARCIWSLKGYSCRRRFSWAEQDAIKIVSRIDLAFKKGFQLKKMSLSWFSFGNIVSPKYCHTFCKQNDVISQKSIGTWNWKQGIKEFFKDILHHSTVLFICINKKFLLRITFKYTPHYKFSNSCIHF